MFEHETIKGCFSNGKLGGKMSISVSSDLYRNCRIPSFGSTTQEKKPPNTYKMVGIGAAIGAATLGGWAKLRPGDINSFDHSYLSNILAELRQKGFKSPRRQAIEDEVLKVANKNRVYSRLGLGLVVGAVAALSIKGLFFKS